MVSVLSLIISIIGTGMTAGSFVYANRTKREKERLERLIHGKLKGIAGNIVESEKSATWADKNFGRCRDKALELDESAPKKEILKHAHNGARDAESTSRMLNNLLNEVLSLQDGLFKTRDMVHPNLVKKTTKDKALEQATINDEEYSDQDKD